MRTRNLFYLIIIILSFTSCENKEIYSIIDIFDKTKDLKKQTLTIDGLSENVINPVDIQIIKDKLVLLDVQSLTPFSIIDLKRQKYLKSYGSKGEGPGEIIGIMDFYVNYDETGINYWDTMLKRLYYCNYDSMLQNKTKCINILEKNKDKKLFNNFYSNVLQIDDSLFIAIGNCGEKRFSLINTKSNKIIQTGEYPKQDLATVTNSMIRAAAYNGTITI